ITGHGGAPTGSLPEVVRLVYEWYAACPDKARLLFLAAPGSTPEIAQTRSEFAEEHVRDLSRYVNESGAPAHKPAAASDLAPRSPPGRRGGGPAGGPGAPGRRRRVRRPRGGARPAPAPPARGGPRPCRRGGRR